MKKPFTILGAIAGLLYGGSIMISTFIKAPGRPGLFELLLQGIIVGAFVFAGALAGLLIGWLVSLCIRKK